MLKKVFTSLKKKKEAKGLKKGLHKEAELKTNNINDTANTLSVLNVNMALFEDSQTVQIKEEEYDSKPVNIGYKYAFKGDNSKHDSSGSSDYSSGYDSSGYDSSNSSSSSDSSSYSSSSSYDSGSSGSFD